MSGISYEEGKKNAWKGFFLLLVVTLLEVGVALLGKGYLIAGVHLPTLVMGLLMISLSLYKAYYIVKEFMHMGYETRGLAMSVLLPTLLLVWAIISFLWEGGTWLNRRNIGKQKSSFNIEKKMNPTTTVLNTTVFYS